MSSVFPLPPRASLDSLSTPCLVLERWTWRETEAITYVRTVVDGDRFDLTARFAAQG